MARNGSGTYTKVNTFTAGTPITAASHNQNWDDVAAEITNSVAADGQTSMTGPLKASSGTAAAPSHTFGSDLDTGAYRSATNEYSVAAGGVQILAVSEDGLDIKGGTLNLDGTPAFPVPTAQIFDKSITYRKLQHPSTTSILLGSNSNAGLTITGAADNGSGLIRLSVADTSTFATGQSKTVSDVVGTTEANGTWTITVVDATRIDLQGSAFANAYVSGGTIGSAFEEIALGTGNVMRGNVLTSPFPPPASFKNLSIKVATNTTVAIAADYVTTTDGTVFQTTALSATLNMATTGANGLDTGSIAQATWYAVFAISKSDGTTATLASTSATSPTMPTGYTCKARIGWVRAATSTAQLLGTWQLGRRAQYKPGLAQTGTAVPTIGTTSSTTLTAKSVVDFVPSTASEIVASLASNTPSGVTGIAPNASYNITYPNVTPIYFGAATASNPFASGSFILEGTDIYVFQVGGLGTFYCNGWVDNI